MQKAEKSRLIFDRKINTGNRTQLCVTSRLSPFSTIRIFSSDEIFRQILRRTSLIAESELWFPLEFIYNFFPTRHI